MRCLLDLTISVSLHSEGEMLVASSFCYVSSSSWSNNLIVKRMFFADIVIRSIRGCTDCRWVTWLDRLCNTLKLIWDKVRNSNGQPVDLN